MYSLTKSELHLKVLQVDLQPMAVPAEGVRLSKLIDGLAVLPEFIGRCTLVAILEVVLGDGQLHCLPPAMSALSHHCCGQWPVAGPSCPPLHVAMLHTFLFVFCPHHPASTGSNHVVQSRQLLNPPPDVCSP